MDIVKAGITMKSRFSFGMIFLTGLVAGILTMGFGKSILLENTGFLDENMLRQMTSAFPDSNALFAYVLRKRLIILVIMVILATTYLGMAACVIADVWFGFSAGAFLAAAVMRYGMKGIFVAAAAVFPQYLLYGPMFYGLLLWCRQTCHMIYGRDHRYLSDTKTPILFGRVLPLLILCVGTLAGCFLESYVNPGIIKGVLKLL